MKPDRDLLCCLAFALAVACAAALVFIMVALPVYREQVFLQRGTIDGAGEAAILIAFVLVLLFDLVSLLWLFSRLRRRAPAAQVHPWLLALGDKVMVAAIGREVQLGWEVTGEWIILYVFLTAQFVYNIAVVCAVSTRNQQWLTPLSRSGRHSDA